MPDDRKPEKAIQRAVMPSKGPKFYEQDGVVMFTYVIDPSSVVGPYKARWQDQADHPEAWAAFLAERAPEPIQTEPTVVASEASPGPTPKRRGPGRPRKKGAGNDASDDDPERL